MGQFMNYKEEADKLKDRLLQSRVELDDPVPRAVASTVAIERGKVEGCPVYRLLPERAHGNIFYLYSSDLVHPITPREWQFILMLCQMTRMAVTVPLYPLAPENDCEDVFRMLLPAYQQFCRRREQGDMVIFGCGNGAGLALSLQLLTWREGLPDPEKLVLLSPRLDTEYFDRDIMAGREAREEQRSGRSLRRKCRAGREKREIRKAFLDAYWVKNYAGRTEYTSPIYADYTDICKDILVVSGTADPLNPYARRFTERVLDIGTPAKFFEYQQMPKDFYFQPKRQETKHMMHVLHDILLNTDTAILHHYMEEVRARADWSKWFPEIFHDDNAIKYVSGHPRAAVSTAKGRNIFNLLNAATQRAVDDAVRLFLMEYPNGTVVYVGCSLDTMLDRVDNGRVKWYDLDTPGRLALRSLYAGPQEREKRIDRSINDLNWMTQLSLEMDKGLLFVVRDIFSYMSWTEMREFLDQLYKNFQGCNVIFDMATPRAKLMMNFVTKRSGAEYRRRRLAMKDPRRELELMNPVYNVISVHSVLENVKLQKDWKPVLKMNYISNRNRESRKLIHLRLGYERYKTFDGHFFDPEIKREHNEKGD